MINSNTVNRTLYVSDDGFYSDLGFVLITSNNGTVEISSWNNNFENPVIIYISNIIIDEKITITGWLKEELEGLHEGEDRNKLLRTFLFKKVGKAEISEEGKIYL